MSPKIDAPYLWIRPLGLVSLQKTFYCNNHIIAEVGIIGSKNSSTAYVILYELIDTWFLNLNRKVGVWSLPWRRHILFIPFTTGRGTGAETCGLDDVFPPDDLCSRPEALCKYIYMHFLYEFCYRTNTSTYNRNVIQFWWSCTPSNSIGLYIRGICGSWVECHFLFSLVYQLCLALWW